MKSLSGFASRNRGWLLAGLWLALVGTFWLISSLRGQSPLELLVQLLEQLQDSGYGALWLVLIYLIRPLLLLPVSILTVFAGFLFGAALGIAFSTVAAVGSAALAYWLARLLASSRTGAPGNMEKRLRENAFEAVLTFRLASMPGDLINYVCGALRVPFVPFLLGTLIGGMPGVFIGVFAGSAITGTFSFDGIEIRWEYVAVSAVLLVAGLLVSRWLRAREGRAAEAK